MLLQILSLSNRRARHSRPLAHSRVIPSDSHSQPTPHGPPMLADLVARGLRWSTASATTPASSSANVKKEEKIRRREDDDD
jgi:hypothetical protein